MDDHIGSDSHKLNKLLEVLLEQYQHIIGEQIHEDVSSEKIIEYIVSYYEDIINFMPGNVYWFDKNCITAGCNKNVLEMFGMRSLSQFKGLTFEDMMFVGQWTPEATLSFKKDTLEVIKSGKPKLNIEEPPIPHHNGKIIYFLTSRVPLFDHLGKIIGAVGISVDITELRNTQIALEKAKEQAEATSRAKSEFVANMSHDAKTPLAGIIGIAELLSRTLEGENQELSRILLMSGRQLLSFFDNCFEVFKLENSDLSSLSEHFNLQTLLQDIYGLFQPAVISKGLTLNIHYPHPLKNCLFGNRAGIYRILLNLISNAVKFTHEGSISIFVDYHQTDLADKVMTKITVIDTGIGIASDKQNIIFERFTRLIPSYMGTYEGSGIGLYIAQKFATSMGGDIQVKSEEGKGSQFIVTIAFQTSTLSVNELQSNEAFLREATETTPSTSKCTPPRILLVEDNLIAQRMQKSLFLSINCELDIVDRGEKALEIFMPGKYDLIFMDVGLPGIQGDIVTKLIRKIEEGTGHHVPIIALTAHTSDEIHEHCLAAGMEGIFSKPLSLEQARSIINRYYSQLN